MEYKAFIPFAKCPLDKWKAFTAEPEEDKYKE